MVDWPTPMGTPHLVVDGSNIATEGRSLPSLQQLLDAVSAVAKELDPENVTVIVDATFGHRIDSSERDAYEEAISKGEIITPPAGVIGRGDAFILEVADRAGAIVLSNDSFQEFHGRFDWLFDEGRLLGAKHVPGVGWIFLARSPVRGPTSRRAVSDAKRKRRGSKQTASTRSEKSSKSRSRAASSKSSAKSASKSGSKSSGRSTTKSTAKSTARSASKSASKVGAGGGQGDRRKSGGKEPEPYNEALPFIEFVGAHPVGSTVEAEVEQFSSHGAYVLVEGTRCYVPLKALADPAPRSAREVLTLGETREFVVVAVDTPRRGIDLALPGVDTGEGDVAASEALEEAAVDEESTAEVQLAAEEDTTAETAAPSGEAERAPSREPADAAPAGGDQKLSVSQRRKLRAQQAAAGEEPSESTETVRETMAQNKKAPARKKAASKKKAPAKKSTAKKAPAKKKSTAKKSPATSKSTGKATSTAKKSPAKKKSTAKKAPAKKSTRKRS